MAISMKLALVVACCMAAAVEGGGWLKSPLGRGSIWKIDSNYLYPDYDHMNTNCGGPLNGCGVCGDNAADAVPRDHEGGGKFGRGVIVETYTVDAIISVDVQFTTVNGGSMEFRLCEQDDPCTPVTQACLDTHLLANAGGVTSFPAPALPGMVTKDLVLPEDLECDHCVLQWKYVTDNSWESVGSRTTFYGCADIAIVASGAAAPGNTTCPLPPAPPPCASWVPTGPWVAVPGMGVWCAQNCPGAACDAVCACAVP